MKIIQLHISGFKNLSDFEIDFDHNNATSVLVGRNGTGKSNVLEAIVIIFRDLDLGQETPFTYSIKYQIADHVVEISSDPHAGVRQEIRIDGSKTSRSTFSSRANNLLPRFVFGYYSGPSSRLEEHFDEHQKRFYRHLIKAKNRGAANDAGEANRILRRLFYARLIHSQFVLLAFFLQKDHQLRELLNEQLRIEGLDSVLFVMREPSWKSADGDHRFWNARGEVSTFLATLYDVALAPLRLTQSTPLGFRKTTRKEHLYLYVKDQQSLARLIDKYSSPQRLFTALESTYISELIADVRIRVNVRGCDGSLTQREMSEGEQQLLLVLGLMRFTAEDESLFLLDEPDTHLNPAWSLRFTQLIRDAVGDRPSTQTIMATHDPLVVAGLTRDQVRVLDRDEDAGVVSCYRPSEDPMGMGIAGLLTSDVYGLRSQLDLETLGKLDRKRVLASKDHLTEEEADELRRLDSELEHLDFAKTVRDPLYALFVDAMIQHQDRKEQSPTLSRAEMAKRVSLAEKVLNDVIGDS